MYNVQCVCVCVSAVLYNRFWRHFSALAPSEFKLRICEHELKESTILAATNAG